MITNSSKTRLGALVTIMVVLAAMFAAAPASAGPGLGSNISERGKIALYVYDATTMSKVPVYKAYVRLHDQSSDRVLSGYTDARGFFGGVVKSGSYFVTVQANAFKDYTFEIAVKPAYTTTAEAGLDKTTPPPPMGIGKATIFVYDANTMWKGPIASAHVVIYNTDGVMADGYTDETGRFLAPLSEGVYGVSVEAKGFKGYGFEIFVKPDSSNEFEVPMDKDAYLGKLGVMAYALTTHIPGTVSVPGATVEIYNSMGELVATGKTDDYGLYIVNIAPDAYNLIITSPDFAPSKTSAIVAVDEATQLNVEMKK